MTSFVISTVDTVAKSLADGEYGVITPSGSLVTTGNAITAAADSDVILSILGSVTSITGIGFTQDSGTVSARIDGTIDSFGYGFHFVGANANVAITGSILSHVSRSEEHRLNSSH